MTRPPWVPFGGALLLCLVLATPSFGSSPGHPSLLPGGAPSLLTAPGADHRPSGPGITTPWSPLSGTPSPGLPHYSLHTISRVTSTCPGSSAPGWLAYDPNDQMFWIATAPNCVDVIPANESTQVGLPVGTDPFGVAVDVGAGEVFVTNTGSGNVTVIDDSTQLSVASIPVGASPLGVAFDPNTREMFVANSGSDTVSVVSDSTLAVVATVAVGTAPVGVTVDARTGQVFVANSVSNNVSVISDRTLSVMATIATGNGSYGITDAPPSGLVFVTNPGSSNVSVINASGDLVVATIPVISTGVTLEGAAYDARTQEVWIGGGLGYIVVLNASGLNVTGYLGTDPSGVAYDSDTGTMCVDQAGNISFACVNRSFTATPLTFWETGLPTGRAWSVDVGFGVATSSSSNLTFGVVPPVYCCSGLPTVAFSVPTAGPYRPTPAHGNITNWYPAPAVISVVFHRSGDLFPVRFSETGLPSGSAWWVAFNGTTNRSVSASDSFWEPNSTGYSYRVVGPLGYVVRPTVGTVPVSGSPAVVDLTFSAPPRFDVDLVETGLPVGYTWVAELNGSWQSSSSTTIRFALSNGSYPYAISPSGAYDPIPSNGTVQVAGVTVSLPVSFTLGSEGLLRYPVTFGATGGPPGAVWAVEVNGSGTLGTNGSTVVYELTNGSYSYAYLPPAGYVAVPSAGGVVVSGAPANRTTDFVPAPMPFVANVSYQVAYAGCGTGGGVTNHVLLAATASGGTRPYSFLWTLPTGTASGPLAETVTTLGDANQVTLNATDAAGVSVVVTVTIPMQLPPCPPPEISNSPPATAFFGAGGPGVDWVIVGLAAALVVTTAAVVWLIRGRRN